MNYQEERFGNIVSELEPLLHEHWLELALNQDVRPLDVDYETYTQLNDIGILRVFTARDLQGKLAGYFSCLLAKNLHYKSWFYALTDVYYLRPEYRNKQIGKQFFREIENWLKGHGVKSLIVQDKIHKSHESFFIKLGYTLTEQNYEKVF